MGRRANKIGQSDQTRILMNSGMEIGLYLQIISILMAVIGVAVPALIAIVGFVFVRSMNERHERTD